MTDAWTNWAGNQHCQPTRIAAPRDLDELVAVVRAAYDDGLALRATGTGHSLSPLVATDGCLVSTRQLRRILRIDGDTLQVEAGALLVDVQEAAWEVGLSLEGGTNYARMSVGGIAATGAHGSSRTHGTLASRVIAVTLVTPDARVVEIDASDPEALSAARLHLGMLGVVYALTLRAEPAYAMHVESYPEPRERALAHIDEMLRRHDHVELYSFPGSDRAWWYLADRDPGMPASRPWKKRARVARQYAMNRGLGAAIFPLVTRWPRLTPLLVGVGGRFQPRVRGELRRSVDAFHNLWTVPPFIDAGVLFDVEHARDAQAAMWQRLASWNARGRHPVSMAMQLRQVGPDHAWLSPTLGRPAAALECVSDVRTRDAEPFFRELVGDLWRRFSARPHWAKLFYGLEPLAAYGERRRAFDRVRRRFDPEGRCLTPLCRDILGLANPSDDQALRAAEPA